MPGLTFSVDRQLQFNSYASCILSVYHQALFQFYPLCVPPGAQQHFVRFSIGWMKQTKIDNG